MVGSTVSNAGSLCDQYEHCRYGDDEIFCSTPKYLSCQFSFSETDIETFLCDFAEFMKPQHTWYFDLANMPIYPREIIDDAIPEPFPFDNKTEIRNTTEIMNTTYVDVWRCNRDISILTRVNSNTLKLVA